MTTETNALRKLTIAAKAVMTQACQHDTEAQAELAAMTDIDLAEEQMTRVTGTIPAHRALLDHAISNIDDPGLRSLKSALMTGRAHLRWQVDNGGYYGQNADVGDGYRTGNMHVLLIGPGGCPFVADDLLLGLFLLAPGTLYRDHRHTAPEIYIPLTGPSGWRFEFGEWEDHPAGAMIFNASGRVHATRVYDTPFLSLFAWTGNTRSGCTVVPCGDWPQIEQELSAHAAPE